MRVLIYLYYPFFEHHLAGGVQVWLRHLLEALQNMDPSLIFDIYCPASVCHSVVSTSNVHPVLYDLEEDFLPLDRVYETLKILTEAEKKADVLWLIDRSFPVPSEKPKLLSLNTICYEREIMSIFQSGWSVMTVPSRFVEDQVRPFAGEGRQIHTIPHYIDPIFYSSGKDPEPAIKRYFDYCRDCKYILSPHRPDPTKGHESAIDILKELVGYDGFYRLLIPLPPDAKSANQGSEQKYAVYLKGYARQQGVADYVVFHPWVSYNDLPAYYSIGQYTLFLSRLPETFGLSLLNSAACGTPTISYGAGAVKEVVEPGPAHIVVKDPMDAVPVILSGAHKKLMKALLPNLYGQYEKDRIVSKYRQLLYQLYQ